MDRIIGIDYGRKRVGVAVTDPLGIFASALDTVHSAKIIDYLKKYASNENVVRFVVGYPMNMNGKPSEAAKDVDIFLKHLAKAFPEAIVVDALAISRELGNERTMNMVLAGALSALTPFKESQWQKALEGMFTGNKAKPLDLNRKAFELGRAAVAK